VSSPGAADVTPADPFETPVDAATRRAVLEETLERIAHGYVDPEVGAAVGAALRRRMATGEYDGITGAVALAKAVTAHLREASRDRHLVLLFPAPPAWPGGAAERAARRRQAALRTFGVRAVERLAGNVGYLNLEHLDEPGYAGAAVAAALRVLAPTFALLLDLRQNHGGHPGMVALVCGYLLGPEPVHLCDFRWRAGGRVEQWWTPPYVPGPRYGADRPVWILTSGATFSGAESLAYFLQNRRRATVVGERTGGGAHYCDGLILPAGFGLSLPAARVRDPLTGTDWEGTGVAPDVEAPAAEALRVAHRAALRHVLATFHATGTRAGRQLREEAERTLADLDRPAS
jgi:hypothetical protein